MTEKGGPPAAPVAVFHSAASAPRPHLTRSRIIICLLIVSYSGIINYINKKHLKTWQRIWHDPLLSGIAWSDIEIMLLALGAEISEGNGSRVRVKLNGVRAVFHRPHPENTTDKGAVKSVRRFLQTAGVTKEVMEHDEI